MGKSFEELTRAASAQPSRRGVLKVLGAAAASAAGATVLRPFRADAATCRAGTTPCGPNCCAAGVACLNARTGKCGCPSGQTQCGTTGTGAAACCSGTCSSAANNCCCPSGTTACGPTCCAAGVACVDKSTGTCGCPAGTTPCGSGSNLTCCSSGQPCNPSDSVCAPPSGSAAGCAGSTACPDCTFSCDGGEPPVCGTVPGTSGEIPCFCIPGETLECTCVQPFVTGDCEGDLDCPSGSACFPDPCGGGSNACLPLCSSNSGKCNHNPCGVGNCGGGDCGIALGADGTCVCVVPTCGSFERCLQNSDCGPGRVCGAGPCCDGNVCLDLCGTAAAQPAVSSGTWQSTPARRIA